MTGPIDTIAKTLDLPAMADLVAGLDALASRSDAARRCIEATRTGVFVHPDGREDRLMDVVLSPEQLALLAHLGAQCPSPLSIEIGFGMGSSATMMLAARRAAGQPFEHIAYDPWGLAGDRGSVVMSYLQQEFGGSFKRQQKMSQVGLGHLIDTRGPGIAGLIFVDGGHTFEAVMADFFLSDALCCVGGYIVFDDALYPAIETVINYIAANRRSYAINHLGVENTTVVRKLDGTPLNWDHFRPFAVPDRRDWTPAKPAPTAVGHD